jgi:hypothetical protein
MMSRLKSPKEEFDIDELDVEWTDADYVKYEGEVPATGEVVNGFIKKMWWTYASDNTPMIKVLFEADDTAGEYEGLPIWENLTFKPSAAFKYGPFLEFFGLTLKNIRDDKYVSDTDDNNGAPLEKIGTFEPGSEDAFCAVAVKRTKYEGKWRAEVGEWLEYDPDRQDAEDETEEEPPARPTRAAAKKPAAGSNGAATSKTRARRAVRKGDPASQDVEEEEAEEEEAEEEPAPTRPARRSARTVTAGARAPATSKPAAAKPAARGRRAARPAADDPPF